MRLKGAGGSCCLKMMPPATGSGLALNPKISSRTLSESLASRPSYLMNLPTFDESWHRVSPRRIRLLPSVEIFPQHFRGERWYVVRDRLSGKFYRLRPPAYEFLCELERCQTVEAAWQARLEADAEHAPGQGEVIQLLSQLHRSGLLRSDVEGDATPVIEALETEQQRANLQRWSSILFFRLPLWNPNGFLTRTLPLVRWLIRPVGFALWLALLLWAGRDLVVNWQTFRQETEGFLGLSNLPWMYACMIVIKVLHEFGHGYFCKRYGGEVPEMGVMLLLFNPLPYVDASASTAFRNKWQRIAVGAAGMIVELGIAAVAAIVWARSGPGSVHVVAYNIILVASVITILFNANPLLRYDGYHMLSDWLETPNLQGRSNEFAMFGIKRVLFGLKRVRNPATSTTEAWWLGCYFVASLLYRTAMMVGILFIISKSYLFFGLVLGVVFAVLWGLVPVIKAIGYLWSAPELDTCRFRACSASLVLVGGLVAFLTLVPMPQHFRADAVVHAEPFSRVYAGTTGTLREIVVPSGTVVEKGALLLRLSHAELDHQLAQLDAEQAKATATARVALEEDPARYAARTTYFRSLAVRRENFLADRAALEVHAPCAGRWLAPDLQTHLNATLARGFELGVVQGEDTFFVSAVVKQEDVSRLFTADQVHEAQVKIRGQESFTLRVRDLTAIPGERQNLPSAALGILGGGTTQVDLRPDAQRKLATGDLAEPDGKGTRTKEAVFEIRAELISEPGVQLTHGERAVARITLASEPLARQWTRLIRQLFQKGYQI